MATLREVQLALQEKMEELRHKDELIDELEDELLSKDNTIEQLKLQLTRYRALVKRLSVLARQQKQPSVKVCQQSQPNYLSLQQHSEPSVEEPPPLQQLPHPSNQVILQDKECKINHLNSFPTHLAVATSTPVKIVEPSNVRNKLIKLQSVNEVKYENNNSPTLSAAAKKRLSFCSDKAKIIGGSESPLFMRFKKY